ncbi:MAG: hypothetical protein HY395_02865 [Candidatus Doudnabacteria bacterium]|nr:hypothetical protein [Candidatus Doudnabacteria bacterium]
MPQLGYGTRREVMSAEQALESLGIHGPVQAVRALAKGVDKAVRDHIITAFGRHPDVQKATQRINCTGEAN